MSMSGAAAAGSIEQHQLMRLGERVLVACAFAVSIAMFVTLGWWASAPEDPLGAVSFLAHPQPWWMLMQLIGLSAVSATVSTLIGGRRVPELGTLTTCVGLAALSLRGAPASAMLLGSTDATQGSVASLGMNLALDTVVWFGVVLVAFVVSAAVESWCFGPRADSMEADREGTGIGHKPGSMDHASHTSPLGMIPAGDAGGRLYTVRSIVITSVIAVVALTLLAAGLSNRSIQHGQAIFLVAAAYWVAMSLTLHIAPSKLAFGPLVSVVLVAVGGYLWTSLRGSAAGPAPIPSTHFLRILPLQFVSIGCAMVLHKLGTIRASPLVEERRP